MRAVELEPAMLTTGVNQNDPGHLCMDDGELKDLAAFKKSCDVCKLNLKDTQAAYQVCVDQGAPATAWWADPKIVIGGFAITLGLGALIGVALSK